MANSRPWMAIVWPPVARATSQRSSRRVRTSTQRVSRETRTYASSDLSFLYASKFPVAIVALGRGGQDSTTTVGLTMAFADGLSVLVAHGARDERAADEARVG